MKRLEPLKRWPPNLDLWHDGKIKPGVEWEHSILTHLEKTGIILLLISIDFINSEYCCEEKLETAMRRHEKREAGDDGRGRFAVRREVQTVSHSPGNGQSSAATSYVDRGSKRNLN